MPIFARPLHARPDLTVRSAARGTSRLAPGPLLVTAGFLMVCFLLPGSDSRGQQPPGISVEVKAVTLLAMVRDKKGQIVSNLGKDDFVLEEDGKPEAITYFTRESDLPLTLGLLVDTSESQRRVLDQERTASQGFLDNMLRDQDRAFLIHFDYQVELLQDMTSSRKDLQSALQLLEPPRPEFGQSSSGNGGGNSGGGNGGGGYGGRGGRGGRGGGFNGGGTLLYDSVFLASDEVIKKQQGRKALVILSDGVDRGSKETLESAIMTAQMADTVVYSIYFTDDQQQGSPFSFGGPGFGGRRGGGRFPQEERPDGKKVLERISKETGGRLFEVSKKQPIEDIYRTIAEELHNQYSLGYTPASDIALGYHKLHLTTKQKDMTVQTRDGFYYSAR